MIPRDPFDLAELTGDYGAVGCAPPSDRAGRASPLNRLRRFRGVPSTGAKVCVGMAALYLVIFAFGAVA